MTLADSGRSTLAIHGPPSLTYALATTRFYAKRSAFALEPHDVTGGEVLRDAYVSVHAVPLSLSDAPHPPPEDAKVDFESHPWKDPQWSPSNLTGMDAQRWYTTVVKDAWGARSGSIPARLPQRLPPPDYPPTVFAYICAGHAQRGKFDVAAVLDQGVPRGPAYARLAAGEDVVIKRPVGWASLNAAQRAEWLRPKKGKGGGDVEVEDVLVRSADVMGSSRAGPVFVYMYLPSPAYIDALLSESSAARFSPYTYAQNAHLGEEQRSMPHVMVHAVPRAVIEDKRYQAWMASFGPNCHHIVANREHCADELVYTSSAASLLRLSKLDSRMFSMPGYQITPAADLKQSMALHGHDFGAQVQPAAVDQVVGLHPRGPPAVLPSSAPTFHVPPSDADAQFACLGETDQQAWETYVSEANRVCTVPPTGSSKADHLEFTTLGTGSSMPSKYRNVLSTLVHVPGEGYILLDAGESTYGLLARRFGPGDNGWCGNGVDHILRNLRLLFVSHIHGDHHMGVARLLRERRMLQPSTPIYLVTNNYTRYYLQEYDAIEPLGFGDENVLVAIDNEDVLGTRTGGESGAALREALHLESIRTVHVSHRARNCYGVVLKHRDGWSLVFSGDTMPTDALVQAGRGASILIHEATMEDVEEVLAHAKGHSTIGQAIDVARRMEAEHVLLTHFSQRYPKLARLSSTESGKPYVGTAFDLMQAKTSDLRRMAAFRPALEMLFMTEEGSEDGESGDENESAPSKRTKKVHEQPPPRQRTVRHTVRDFDYRYVVLSFAAKMPFAVPGELSIHAGVMRALEEMHGVVGGAIQVDVLNVGATRDGAEAVVRVSSADSPALTAALSGMSRGQAYATLTGGQDVRVSVRYVTHCLPMISDSRSWLRDCEKD